MKPTRRAARRAALTALFGGALALRLAFAASAPAPTLEEARGYELLAVEAAGGRAPDDPPPRGLPAPGYPLFLTFALPLLGGVKEIYRLQAALGAATCIAAAGAARSLGAPGPAALGAGAALAVTSALARGTGLLLPETLFALAAVSGVWALAEAGRRRGAARSRLLDLGGALLGGAAAVRWPGLVLPFVAAVWAASLGVRPRSGIVARRGTRGEGNERTRGRGRSDTGRARDAAIAVASRAAADVHYPDGLLSGESGWRRLLAAGRVLAAGGLVLAGTLLLAQGVWGLRVRAGTEETPAPATWREPPMAWRPDPLAATLPGPLPAAWLDGGDRLLFALAVGLCAAAALPGGGRPGRFLPLAIVAAFLLLTLAGLSPPRLRCLSLPFLWLGAAGGAGALVRAARGRGLRLAVATGVAAGALALPAAAVPWGERELLTGDPRGRRAPVARVAYLPTDATPSMHPDGVGSIETELFDGLRSGSGEPVRECVLWRGPEDWKGFRARLVVDLGAAALVEEVQAWTVAPYLDFRIDEVAVRWSADGSRYEPAGIARNERPADLPGTFPLTVRTAGVLARYLEISLDQHPGTGTAIPLCEVRVWGRRSLS